VGRGRPDERPEIEVLGADRGLVSTETVTTGGPRPGRARRFGLVGLAVLGLLVAGQALDDGDRPSDGEPSDGALAEDRPGEPASTTSRPRGTTTLPTTTTTLPAGPPLGGPVEGTLLVYGSGVPRWTAVDLATGARREVRLPGDNPYGALAVRGGVVITTVSSRGLGATFYDLSEDEPEGVYLGPGDYSLPSRRSDQVWVVAGADRFEGEPPSGPITASLVDLTGAVVRTIEVEVGIEVLGVSDAGVIGTRGGRLYVTDESGARALADGVPQAVAAGRAVVEACDDQARCELRLLDVDSGTSRPLGPAASATYGMALSPGPDGLVAVSEYDGSSGAARLRLLLPDGTESSALPLPAVNGLPGWLPDGSGLVVADERRVGVVRWVDGELRLERVERLADLAAELVLVVSG
jgi:hypothetical protein